MDYVGSSIEFAFSELGGKKKKKKALSIAQVISIPYAAIWGVLVKRPTDKNFSNNRRSMTGFYALLSTRSRVRLHAAATAF